MKYLAFLILLACATVHYSTVKKVVKTNGVFIIKNRQRQNYNDKKRVPGWR